MEIGPAFCAKAIGATHSASEHTHNLRLTRLNEFNLMVLPVFKLSLKNILHHESGVHARLGTGAAQAESDPDGSKES